MLHTQGTNITWQSQVKSCRLNTREGRRDWQDILYCLLGIQSLQNLPLRLFRLTIISKMQMLDLNTYPTPVNVWFRSTQYKNKDKSRTHIIMHMCQLKCWKAFIRAEKTVGHDASRLGSLVFKSVCSPLWLPVCWINLCAFAPAFEVILRFYFGFSLSPLDFGPKAICFLLNKLSLKKNPPCLYLGQLCFSWFWCTNHNAHQKNLDC